MTLTRYKANAPVPHLYLSAGYGELDWQGLVYLALLQIPAQYCLHVDVTG
jgi:hypothetical protein